LQLIHIANATFSRDFNNRFIFHFFRLKT
jgi:hypothetical protein